MDLTIDGENFEEVGIRFFRKLVKNLLPYYFVKKFQEAHENKNQCVKEYDSYDNALKDCPTQNAYENTELCLVIADKTNSKSYKKYSGEAVYAKRYKYIFSCRYS
ncbi:MAG: hypothetical protein LBI14_10570 [Treponema sp.]|jgi:hypothetical protein|nr:hypothetical protein [Treponema sp.]